MRAVDSVGAVAEADDPVGGVLAVVARFLDGLAGDRRELGVARAPRAAARAARGRSRRRSCAASSPRSRRAAARPACSCGSRARRAGRRAGPRRGASPPSSASSSAGARQHGARLADEVERHVAEGDVLLDDRRVAAPLGEALRQDQAGVADAQQVLHRRVRRDGDRWRIATLTCGRATSAARRRSGGGRPCLPSDRSTTPCRPGRSP